MKKINLILSIILFATISCETTEGPTLEAISPEIIASGNLYGAGIEGFSAQNLMISNQVAWDALILKMNVDEDFTAINIDFTTHQLVAIIDDLKSNGGHTLAANMIENSDNIVIEVVRANPEGGATAVMTQPYLIARLPVSDKPIIFK